MDAPEFSSRVFVGTTNIFATSFRRVNFREKSCRGAAAPFADGEKELVGGNPHRKERGQRWERALGIIEEMRKHAQVPDVITCNTGLSACQKSKQWA